MTTLEDRIFTITGHTSDIGEALDEFENVKCAVAELFDDNQALSILNRRLILTLSFATQAIDVIERDVQMFMTPKDKQWVEKFREQMKKIEAARVQSKMITGKEKTHA